METFHPRISVVIPLYNKRQEAERTVRSVLEQTYAPVEVIVVDDGSTDGSARIVENIESPLLKLIRQPNAGVSVARNRGTEVASGEFVAFLDADDWWEPGFLAEIASLIGEFPNCGIYATDFRISRDGVYFPSTGLRERGVVREYFRQAMSAHICTTSSICLPRAALLEAGGFPPGMKLGEDLYLETKVACRYPVCYSPLPGAVYNISASNRSSAIYTSEKTDYSFDEFYTRGVDFYLDEYIAKCAIAKAITLAAKGDREHSRHVERFYAYTKLYRLGLWKLRMLNRMPRSMRHTALSLYNKLAWAIARKGM